MNNLTIFSFLKEKTQKNIFKYVIIKELVNSIRFRGLIELFSKNSKDQAESITPCPILFLFTYNQDICRYLIITIFLKFLKDFDSLIEVASNE